MDAAPLGFGDDPLHLARADHARLIDHQHVFGPELLAALCPLMLEAGNRARRYARTTFEILGGYAGQGGALDAIAGLFPPVARNTQHGRFASVGVTGDDCEIAAATYVPERGLLFIPQCEPVTCRGGNGSVQRRRGETMTAPLCKDRRRPFKTLLGLDHRPRSEPLLAASVLAERDHLGRPLDRCEHSVEMLMPIAVAVNELGKVAGRECRLPAGDRIERQRRIGEQLLAVGASDGMMLDQSLASPALLGHVRSRRTNLVLRLKVDPLGFKHAMIDASVDIQLGKTRPHPNCRALNAKQRSLSGGDAESERSMKALKETMTRVDCDSRDA